MSNAVSMFLRQVVLQRGIPYEMKLPKTELLNYGSLTREQFDTEMEKGMADVKAGRVMMCCHFCGYSKQAPGKVAKSQKNFTFKPYYAILS